MTDLPGTPDPAKGRFAVIQMLRLSGVAIVLVALLVINRKIDLPEIVGYALLVAGLLDVFVMPMVLAKVWKSPIP